MSLQWGRIADIQHLPTEVCVTLIRAIPKQVCPTCEKPAILRFSRFGAVSLYCDGCGRMPFCQRTHPESFVTLHLVPTNAAFSPGDMIYYRDVPYEIDADIVVWKARGTKHRKESKDFYVRLRKPVAIAAI